MTFMTISRLHVYLDRISRLKRTRDWYVNAAGGVTNSRTNKTISKRALCRMSSKEFKALL